MIHTRFCTILKTWLLLCALVASGSTAYAQYPGFNPPDTRVAGGGAVGIVPVAPVVDGGSVPIGATAQVVVLFRNEGAQPVETGQINLYPSSTVSAHVSMNQCAEKPLESGAECAIALSVKGLQAGPWRVEMLMMHSGKTRLVTDTITGTVDSSGDAKISSDVETIPSKVEFNTLASGQTMLEPVILRNITSAALEINEVFINAGSNSGYSVQSDCKSLQAGQACIATVTWSPKQKGPATGVLVVKHSGPSGLTSVPLTGIYEPGAVSEALVFPEAVPGKGLMVSSQETVDFGSDVATASTITVSLVNTGDSAMTIKNIKLSGSDNGLSFSNAGCTAGLVLQPIEACPLTLSWSPTRVGTLLDDIQIIHDGVRGILVLPIRGTAVAVVSQDQKAILLSEPSHIIGGEGVAEERASSQKSSGASSPANLVNPSSVLDGLKITSFAPSRAIINGPGGSRLVYNNEEVMLGGILWNVTIQKNGIEFTNEADRVLLLFDRSLSSVSRVSGGGSSSSSSSSSSGSSAATEAAAASAGGT